MPKSKPLRSAVVIGKLLSTEGFNDHVAGMVEKYWKKSAGLNERQRRQIKKLERALSRVCGDMPIGDRLILGKFIGLHKKMSFDTGLKIGLQAFATRQDREFDHLCLDNPAELGNDSE
jgi:hypothetical protein